LSPNSGPEIEALFGARFTDVPIKLLLEIFLVSVVLVSALMGVLNPWLRARKSDGGSSAEPFL
jgi:hypothetical protein